LLINRIIKPKDNANTRKWKTGIKCISADTFLKNGGSAGGPYPKELARKLQNQMKEHPNYKHHQVTWLREQCPGGDGDDVIFTVPYCPKSNPVENAWANVKNFAAQEYRIGRTADVLMDDLMRGFYGGASRHASKPWHKGVGPKQVRGYIKDSHAWMNIQIEKMGSRLWV
jgi:hypothetical protein